MIYRRLNTLTATAMYNEMEKDKNNMVLFIYVDNITIKFVVRFFYTNSPLFEFIFEYKKMFVIKVVKASFSTIYV